MSNILYYRTGGAVSGSSSSKTFAVRIEAVETISPPRKVGKGKTQGSLKVFENHHTIRFSDDTMIDVFNVSVVDLRGSIPARPGCDIYRAVELGFGNPSFAATVIGLLQGDGEVAPLVYVPLFSLGEDIEVDAKIVLRQSSTGNPNYLDAVMPFFGGITILERCKEIGFSIEGGECSFEIGMISTSWSLPALRNRISAWFADYLAGLDDDDMQEHYMACSNIKHNETWVGSQRGVIKVMLDGVCDRCTIAERARSSDIPF